MRNPIGFSCVLCALLLHACGGGTQDQEQEGTENIMLIIAAEGLEQAAAGYAAFRESTGFEVELLSTGDLLDSHAGHTLEEAVGLEIAAFAVRAAAEQEPYALLIGDANVDAAGDTALIPTTVGRGDNWYEYGDTPYADLDGDGLPDLSIGRLPFRTPGQVESYLARIEQHEKSYSPGICNKTISAFAGEGGFGPLIDGLLEMAAAWVFDDMSYDFDMTMTYASDGSEYYLPYTQWMQDYTERYRAGAVLMPYIGHTLDEVTCCDDQPPARRGMLAFFSCGDGTFQEDWGDDPHPSLAERVLLREQGPVASMGATSVSHPYGNAILPRELGHAILDLREPTYGRALMVAKYNMVHRIDDLRETIDAAAEPYCTEELGDLIESHVVMYNLLGDPAAPTLIAPGKVKFDAPGNDFLPGQTAVVSGRTSRGSARSPVRQGNITVSIETRRTEIPGELPPRDPENHDPDLCRQNHAIANDKVVATAEGTVEDLYFDVELEIPADLEPGEYFLKGYACDDELDAVGSLKVIIE